MTGRTDSRAPHRQLSSADAGTGSSYSGALGRQPSGAGAKRCSTDGKGQGRQPISTDAVTSSRAQGRWEEGGAGSLATLLGRDSAEYGPVRRCSLLDSGAMSCRWLVPVRHVDAAGTQYGLPAFL